jgi:signal transduction histidine kinase/CheY-like chemotaxis protein/HPt (histidine-containing phosphotransfer) domain-containing protein
MSSRQKIYLGVLGAILIVGVLGWTAHRALQHAFAAAGQATEAQQRLTQLHATLEGIEAAESAQRGYLLTEDRRHLEKLRAGVGETEVHLAAYAAFIDPSDARHSQLATLREQIERRISLLHGVIAILESAGLGAAISAARTGGPELMDSIAALGAEMQAREQSILEERQRIAARSQGVTRGTILLGAATGIVLVLVTGGLLRWDLGRWERAEQELRRTSRVADAANRAKTQFLATISHEIRTPLNAILGMTELALEAGLDPDQEELVRTAHANSESLLLLVNDLLDTSKLEAGEVYLEKLPFSVRDVVEGVAEILALRAEAKGLILVTRVDPALPELVLGDPARLRQVVMNLLSNSIKFTERGEVMAFVDFLPRAGGPQMRIRVTDTGVGIAQEDQERIFHRFVQAESTTTRGYGGTGLGLNITRSLVEMMGGWVQVESEPGRGSNFTVTLPIEAAPGRPAPRPPSLTGLRITIVDPVDARRCSLRETLEAAGAGVRDFPSLDLARVAGAEAAADVVIVDEGAVSGSWRGALHALGGGEGTPRLVLLCSLDTPRGSDADGVPEVVRVFKPVRQARLLDAVLGRSAVEHPRASESRVADPGIGLKVHPRILVVEDSPDGAAVVGHFLEGEFDLDFARDGVAAVERATRYAYDLILMDVEMPGMDGFGATRAIRAQEDAREAARVPIVALTAHAMEGFRERCLAAGMDDYVTKPISKAMLQQVVWQRIDPRPVVLLSAASPEVHLLVRRFLPATQYRVVPAHDGQQAIAAFQRQRISVVVLDLDLPAPDGGEVARMVRSTREGSVVPILGIGEEVSPDERERCHALSCDAYLAMPLRRSEFREVMDRLLQSPPRSGEADPSARRSAPGTAPAADAIAPVREAVTRIRRAATRGDFTMVAEAANALRRQLAGSGASEIRPLVDELEAAAISRDEPAIGFWNARILDRVKQRSRLIAVRASGLLDSPPEDFFDQLTATAARLLAAPITLLTVVDHDRQYFKSTWGTDGSWGRETPLDRSVCQYVVQSGDPLLIGDLRQEPLTRGNPAVCDGGVVAYAGAPVFSPDGAVLGSFCAIDTAPRTWTDEDRVVLQSLATLVTRELKRRSALQEGREADVGAAAERSGTQPNGNADDEIRDPRMEQFGVRFVQERLAEAETLPTLIQQARFHEVRRIGHQIRGSAATFGFGEIGQVGMALEAAAESGDREAMEAAAHDLRERLRHASSQVQADG